MINNIQSSFFLKIIIFKWHFFTCCSSVHPNYYDTAQTTSGVICERMGALCTSCTLSPQQDGQKHSFTHTHTNIQRGWESNF